MKRLSPLVLFLLLAGCSENKDAAPTDGGADASLDAGDGGDAAPEASTALVSPVCPPKVPNALQDCDPVGITCEYGQDPNPNCNVVATCSVRSKQWSVAKSLCGDAGPSQPAECPETYAKVPIDDECSTFGIVCNYPERRCGCVKSKTDDGGALGTWACEQPASECPKLRPRFGEGCDTAGLLCDYGGCLFTGTGGGATVQCTDGYWQQASPNCVKDDDAGL